MTTTIDLAAVRHAFLQHHNTYRAAHQAPALVQGATLDETAQRWAEYLAATGKIEHSDDGQRNGAGENIYVSVTTVTIPPTPDNLANEVVTCWYDEVAKYDYANGQSAIDTDHFTQMVWKASAQLGTGVKLKSGRIYLVCHYSPAGNYYGEFTHNVIRP